MTTPSPLVVAVTGHRRLPDPAAVSRAIGAVLFELARVSESAPGSPRALELISCLAEGADRLAAHEILGLPAGVLRALLPLEPDDYEIDFPSRESRLDFRFLMDAAASRHVVPVAESREAAYRAAGCHAVDACDILLAVWDGRPGRGAGGTSAIVAYGREKHKPLIIIDSVNPRQVTRERLWGT